MKSFIFEVDKDIMRFEVEYGRVDTYLLKKNRKGGNEFVFQSTNKPWSVLRYFKHRAEVSVIRDYNYTSISDFMKVLNDAKEREQRGREKMWTDGLESAMYCAIIILVIFGLLVGGTIGWLIWG